MAGIKMPSLGPFKRPLRFLPPLNFITIHYIYFFATCLLFAIIFWGSNTDYKVSFTDSLFLCVSAMTEAGLNTVNLSELNSFQQIILFFLIMLGSAIWVSGWVVLVRKATFERKFKDIIEERKRRRGRSRSRSRIRTWTRGRRSGDLQRSETSETQEKREDTDQEGSAEHSKEESTEKVEPYSSLDGTHDRDGAHDYSAERDLTPPGRRGGPEMDDELPSPDILPEDPSATSPHRGITFAGDTRFSAQTPGQQPLPVKRRRNSNLFNMQGVGARPSSSLGPQSPLRASLSQERPELQPFPTGRHYKDFSGWLARNSQFHGLSEKEREKLGGYEYRAVSLLAWLVPAYFVLWQLLGSVACAAWVANYRADTARSNGLNPWWVGAFNAVSAFNNSGMSPLDANMTAFQDAYYLLITMSLLILAGNTCFPVFLRLIVWCMWRMVETKYFVGAEWEERAKTLRFLLDHPRRCYTNLFPSQHTWWLLMSVVVLNGTDWAAFEILNIRNSALNSTLPTNMRVIDGLFQAFAVRSGGFYVVALPSLRISLQFLYVVMMYISAYPVLITIRNSNVYEERSLGIYAEDQYEEQEKKENDADAKSSRSARPGFLRRALTLHDAIITGRSNRPAETNSHFVRQQLRAQLAHDAWWIVLALFLILIIENPDFVAQPAVFSVFNFIFEIVSAYGCVGISVGVPWAAYSFCGSWSTLSKLILCAVMLRGRHRGLPVAIDKAVLLPGEENWMAEEEDGRIRLARTMSRGRQEVA
ncbi:hypothetical protein LTR78_005983 [Recurvomyces mirabilis]|uniref:Potassium transport protein n=1 Tax=Recurvomyces mirabilis TaxID=574656 RepID=A0AAE0WLY5_9PEZI|nr:hypothetical protein LTR78_005983 [Recurvomyces mirabilis]